MTAPLTPEKLAALRRFYVDGPIRCLLDEHAALREQARQLPRQYAVRPNEESADTYSHPWHSPACYEGGAHRDRDLCTCGLTALEKRCDAAEALAEECRRSVVERVLSATAAAAEARIAAEAEVVRVAAEYGPSVEIVVRQRDGRTQTFACGWLDADGIASMISDAAATACTNADPERRG